MTLASWQQVLAIRQRREDEALQALNLLRSQREHWAQELARTLEANERLAKQRRDVLAEQQGFLMRSQGAGRDCGLAVSQMKKHVSALQSLSHKLCTLSVWRAHVGVQLRRAEQNMEQATVAYRRTLASRQRCEMQVLHLRRLRRLASAERADANAEEQALQFWSRHA